MLSAVYGTVLIQKFSTYKTLFLMMYSTDDDTLLLLMQDINNYCFANIFWDDNEIQRKRRKLDLKLCMVGSIGERTMSAQFVFYIFI